VGGDRPRRHRRPVRDDRCPGDGDDAALIEKAPAADGPAQPGPAPDGVSAVGGSTLPNPDGLRCFAGCPHTADEPNCSRQPAGANDFHWPVGTGANQSIVDPVAEVLGGWDASLLTAATGRCATCNGDGSDPEGWRTHVRSCPISVTAHRLADIVWTHALADPAFKAAMNEATDPNVHHHFYKWSEVKAERDGGPPPTCTSCGEAAAR
jgi:hypothetical protein